MTWQGTSMYEAFAAEHYGYAVVLARRRPEGV